MLPAVDTTQQDTFCSDVCTFSVTGDALHAELTLWTNEVRSLALVAAWARRSTGPHWRRGAYLNFRAVILDCGASATTRDGCSGFLQ